MAVEDRQRLAAEHERGRAIAALDCHAPALRDLVRVGGAEYDHVRDCSQRRQVLDGLVGRAIFAQANRVVGVHEDRRELAERGQTQRRPHVVTEYEKGRAECAQATVIDDAVGDRAHGVLANAIKHVAAGIAPRCPNRTLAVRRQVGRALEIAGALERRVGGWIQVGAATHQLGQRRGNGIDDGSASRACGELAILCVFGLERR